MIGSKLAGPKPVVLPSEKYVLPLQYIIGATGRSVAKRSNPREHQLTVRSCRKENAGQDPNVSLVPHKRCDS